MQLTCVPVLVWISECGSYVCNKKIVCVHVIFEREKLYCSVCAKPQIQPLCVPAELGCRPNKILLKARYHSISAPFRVFLGVRQGGFLSSVSFNLYMDELSGDLMVATLAV